MAPPPPLWKKFPKNTVFFGSPPSVWWFDDQTEICGIPAELQALSIHHLVSLNDAWSLPPEPTASNVPVKLRKAECKAGTFGCIVGETPGKIRVKWDKVKKFDDRGFGTYASDGTYDGTFKDLDILTPPMTIARVSDLEAIARLFGHL